MDEIPERILKLIGNRQKTSLSGDQDLKRLKHVNLITLDQDITTILLLRNTWIEALKAWV